MSEEKLYALKNARGNYLSISPDTLFHWHEGQVAATTSQRTAHDLCTQHGGHVVTLIEEPEKVTVSPNEAKAIESLLNADTYADVYDPFRYLFTSMHKEDIKRLIKAIKNGYTVEKEKKYKVKVPHTKDVWYYKSGDSDLLAICPADKELRGKFTEAEIEHYGLQDCEKEEVTEDEQ
ncbi:DUF1642 domain-containing protein [Lacticaseibacillus paracasei]|uniref:DUF1642 domain-containing protein n=1 Tax=Lacticaseibacillus paracasei TaxID=1597 RepID=UPI0021A34FEA|nr:DUF1642 domain-containing protein [Lacticaseibacillus paracasei]MCT2894076.1 DUF1642 domain-containing protein [Lacticaseibacillus paracasei]